MHVTEQQIMVSGSISVVCIVNQNHVIIVFYSTIAARATYFEKGFQVKNSIMMNVDLSF